jgi:SAM-dependent methyltransferase
MQCRVCSGSNLVPFLDLGDQPHCNSLLAPEQLDKREPYYPLAVSYCRDCTTVQLTYTVPKEVMFSEYLYVSGTTRTLREHFAETTKKLVAELGLTSDHLVVDIGSNDGTWLACYKPYGVQVLGVEPARNIAAMANEAGVPTLNRFFNLDAANEIMRTQGRPTLVTAAGVFFHLEELHSVTEGVAKLIGHEGVFYVQAIYLGEMLKNTEFDNIYHEHLTYWTLRSIGELFDRHGLEVFSAGLLPIHGGSLELKIAAKGSRPVEQSVHDMMAAEKATGMHELETYEAFAGRVWEMKDALHAILAKFKAEGKTVHCFGAPAKGATMLNSFGITAEHTPFATERNPLKIGKVIPGARIPIIDEATAPKADAYLILPWNFLREFLVRNRDYIMGGGQFIVPVPFPYVIDQHNYEQHLASL